MFSVSSYQLTIVAVDGGSPPLSGTVIVLVNILDVNDNSPTFAEVAFETRVPEDAAPGTVVFRASATDADLGSNARLRYGFTDETLARHGDVFGVRTETGAVYTRRQLDYELQRDYTLYVTASDRADLESDSSSSLTGMTSIIVRVVDVNDNAPDIRFNFRQRAVSTPVVDGRQSDNDDGGDDEGGSNDRRRPIFVDCDAPDGTFVAHVTVRDADSGDNGRFRCVLTASGSLSSPDSISGLPSTADTLVGSGRCSRRFVLRQLYATELVILTADRLLGHDDVANAARVSTTTRGDVAEIGSDARQALTVYCADAGRPQLTAEASIDIIIGSGDGAAANDEFNNDASALRKKIFRVVVARDTPVGSTIFCARSTIDDDSNSVAHLSFGMIDVVVAPDQKTGRRSQISGGGVDGETRRSGTEFLEIDGKTGIVSVKTRFDGTASRKTPPPPCRVDVDIEIEYAVIAGRSGQRSYRRRMRLVVFVVDSPADHLVMPHRTTVDETSSSFAVFENRPSGTHVGTLSATTACLVDDDVTFSVRLVSPNGDVSSESSPFKFNPKTGSLSTTQQLDGEQRRNYALAVYAQLPVGELDFSVGGGCGSSSGRNGVSPLATVGRTKKGSGASEITESNVTERRGAFVVAKVHVAVNDVNDNPPTVEFPASQTSAGNDDRNNAVEVPCDVPVGHTVTRIMARDPDVGDNARLVYRILRSGEPEANKFDISLSSGEYNAQFRCISCVDISWSRL